MKYPLPEKGKPLPINVQGKDMRDDQPLVKLALEKINPRKRKA